MRAGRKSRHLAPYEQLVAALTSPALAEGKCVGTADPDMFFEKARRNEAVQFCSDCPVTAQCREASRTHDSWGVWGGDALGFGDIQHGARMREAA